MKGFRTTWLFIAVVAALAGYTYYEFKHAAEDLDRAQGERRAFTLNRDDLNQVEMTSGGATSVLRRESGDWKMVKPVEDDAENSAVEGYLFQVLSLKLKTLDDEKSAEKPDWAAYGLEPPRATVELSGKGRKESLAISSKNAFDGSFYVRQGDELLLADAGIAQVAERQGSSLRSRRLWRAPDDVTIEKATVQFEKENFTFTKDKDGWTVDPKPAFPVDPVKISAWVEKVKDLIPSDFVKEGIEDKDKTEYLLKKPSQVITFSFRSKDGKDNQWVLTIGQNKGDEFFVHSNLRPTIYKATRAAIEQVQFRLPYFRDGHPPFQFQVEQAREVRLRMANLTHTFRKADSGWVLTGAEAKESELDQEKLVQLFQNIRNLEAQEFVSVGTGFKGQTQIEIVGESGAPVFSLAWGDEYKAKSPWNKNLTFRYVKTNLGGNAVFGLAKDKLEKLADGSLVRKKAPVPAATSANMSQTNPEKK